MASFDRARVSVRVLVGGAALLLAAAPALADNVQVSIKGTKLVIKGDGELNELTLTGDGGGTGITVTPAGDTTINGQPAAQNFLGVTHIVASLGGGDDSFTCVDVVISGKLAVNGSSGADAVGLGGLSSFAEGVSIVGSSGSLSVTGTDVETGALVVKGSSDGDSISWTGGTVAGKAKLSLGPSANTLFLTGTTFNDDLALSAGNGDDTAFVDAISVGGRLSAALGSGTNLLTLQMGSVGADYLYKGGSAADLVTVRGSTIGTECKLALSSGENTVTMDDGASGPPGPPITHVSERLLISGGGGLDTILGSEASQVGDECRVVLSSGNNLVSLVDMQIGTNLVIKTGGGDDTFVLAGTSVGGATDINDGSGNDVGP